MCKRPAPYLSEKELAQLLSRRSRNSRIFLWTPPALTERPNVEKLIVIKSLDFSELQPDERFYFTSRITPMQTSAAESQRRRSTFSCRMNFARIAEQI